jgi:hypothetical protein
MSKFSMFSSVKAQRGERCTQDKFNEVSASPVVRDLCEAVAAETDHNKQGLLKKQLPIITFQAYFAGARKNALAEPSGVSIYDGDNIENPREFYEVNVAPRIKELGILYAGMTPSRHGLRLVFAMRPEFACIAEAQMWMSGQIGWECDPACKDLARASYVVPREYVYFLDPRLFEDEPLDCFASLPGETTPAKGLIMDNNPQSPQPKDFEPDYSLLFKGLPLANIAREWLIQTGGEPSKGERNDRLHALALRLRHITDYDEQTLLAVMPRYGLSEEEMKTIIHSACKADRTGRPRDLQPVLDKLMLEKESYNDEEDELPTNDSQLTTLNFPLPPLIRQIASTAPPDFVAASILCQLPLLGTLGSKLRARYLDGRMHSPSFQVSLEAPQASGKSFMTRIAETLMAPVLNRDAEERQKEQEYAEKLAELKVTNVKLTPENRQELLGQKPKGIIRYVPATISITKLLQRLDNARGLHLFALAEEIDTVTKAFKRGFSSYGDLLRVAFDNGLYGQDYASAESFSGMVTAYYNTLFSGTPKAMRRFYPDVEDGLVSRVCFVMLPDQFGKPMPVWGELKEKDMEEVKRQLDRLDKVSLVDNTVQPDHVMDLAFLNRDLKKWLSEQQEEAVRTNDRTRDVFCRRSAVVGFRAGMLAWFLYGEKDSPVNRRRTIAFARWVANQMLTQHLLRFEICGTGSNANRWEDVFSQMPDEFNREDLQRVLVANGVSTPLRNVLYNWRLLGCIEPLSVEGCKKKEQRFRKTKT